MSSDSSPAKPVLDLKPCMLIGRYMMLREIGDGTFSSVWMGFDLQSSDFCALKICSVEEEDTLQLEVDIGLLLANKAVERTYTSLPIDSFSFEQDDEQYFCGVFKLYGGSLRDVFECPKYVRGLPLMVALRFLAQQLHALDVVHREFKVLHTDIRPDNILVSDMPAEYVRYMESYRQKMRAALQGRSPQNTKVYESLNKMIVERLDTNISRMSQGYRYELGDRSFCVLHDFGLARDDESGYFRLIANKDYRAPENIMGCEVSRGCDVWSLGCVFFQMLTGKHIFVEKNLDEGPKEERMLQLMFAVVGYPPDSVIASCPRRDEFFVQKRRKYVLSVDQPLPAERVPLRKLLEQHVPQRLSKRSMDLVTGLLQKLMHSDPSVRDRFNYRSAINEINAFLKSHGQPTSPVRGPRPNQPRDNLPTPPATPA